MTPRQRRYFLASHAGMWCWRAPDGVYVARALHEGRQHFRRFSCFLLQHYRWDGTRYRRPVKLVERIVPSDLEADLLLAEIAGAELAAMLQRFKLPAPEPGELPDPLYTHQGRGLSWFFDQSDGLYLVRMMHDIVQRTYYGSTIKVSFRPYDGRHRWVTLGSQEYKIKTEAETAFTIAVTDIDNLLMTLAL